MARELQQGTINLDSVSKSLLKKHRELFSRYRMKKRIQLTPSPMIFFL